MTRSSSPCRPAEDRKCGPPPAPYGAAGGEPLGPQMLEPQRRAAAVPDTDLEDAARPEIRRRPEAVELVDELPVLVEREAFAAELPALVPRLFQAKHEVAQDGAIGFPRQALEHDAPPRSIITPVASRYVACGVLCTIAM